MVNEWGSSTAATVSQDLFYANERGRGVATTGSTRLTHAGALACGRRNFLEHGVGDRACEAPARTAPARDSTLIVAPANGAAVWIDRRSIHDDVSLPRAERAANASARNGKPAGTSVPSRNHSGRSTRESPLPLTAHLHARSSRQVFGLTGSRCCSRALLLGGLPELSKSSVPKSPVVPDYRCGAAPE